MVYTSPMKSITIWFLSTQTGNKKMSNFDSALVSFVAGCQDLVDADNLAYKRVLHIKPGRKYIKIVAIEEWSPGGSAYCFVNKETGDVLKPASWSAPAKHARGNIFDEYNGLRFMSSAGPATFR